MRKPIIVFLCHVSNPEIRESLDLHNYSFRRLVYNIKGGKTLYEDFAIWVTDYIEEFEKHPEFEFHVVAPHWGMKKVFQNFVRNGISYHFFKCNNGLIYTIVDKYFHIEESNENSVNRRRIESIINGIKPDIVINCGAENPYYAAGVIDIKNIPVYLILQTLLNDPKRIEMGLGTPYKRKMELEIFRNANYFTASGEKTKEVIKSVNPKAVFLPVRFPSHRPNVLVPEIKEYDFTFFAMHIAKNKGIEDLLHAISIIKNSKKDVSLNIIGKCPDDYMQFLILMIKKLDIDRNVHFAGYYQQIEDTFNNVVKARAVVVPGITALNSTVRESMLMGMPTICYELPTAREYNKDRICVLVAPVGDIKGLSDKMMFVLQHPEEAKVVANNGKIYADKYFSNESIVNELLDNARRIINKEV